MYLFANMGCHGITIGGMKLFSTKEKLVEYLKKYHVYASGELHHFIKVIELEPDDLHLGAAKEAVRISVLRKWIGE